MQQISKASQYCGKTVARIEDGRGNQLDTLHMMDAMQIVFTDGVRVLIRIDHYGLDEYMCQHKAKGE